MRKKVLAILLIYSVLRMMVPTPALAVAAPVFDTATYTAYHSGAGTFSDTYTIGAVNNSILLCTVYDSSNSGASQVSSVAFNGQAMTRINYAQIGGGSLVSLDLYYGIPTTTSNVVTFVATGGSSKKSSCYSATGVNPSISFVPTATDATTTSATTATAASWSNTLTTITDNSLVVTMSVSGQLGAKDTGSTNVTERGTCVGNTPCFGDNNGGVTPAGGLSQTWTVTPDDSHIMFQVSISPPPAAATPASNDFLGWFLFFFFP